MNIWLLPSHNILSNSIPIHIKIKEFRLLCFFEQMVYGREVVTKVDMLALTAMVDYWFSATATRKDFELARGRVITTIEIRFTACHH